MDLRHFDECDAEVWMCFPENFKEPQEFTCLPQRCGLVKPIPVRLEPPFPWDCEAGHYQNREVSSKRTSAFIPVGKTMTSGASALKDFGPQLELQEVSQKAKVKDIQLTLQLFGHGSENSHSETQPREPDTSLQQKLTSALSELDSLRIDLHTTKLYAKGLAQKNTKLHTRLGKYKTENRALKRAYESLVEERQRMMVEMTELRLGQGDGHCVGLEGPVKRSQDLVGSVEECRPTYCDPKDMLLGCPTSRTSGTICVSPKECPDTVGQKKQNKKRSVFKQLRNAFRKMTA